MSARSDLEKVRQHVEEIVKELDEVAEHAAHAAEQYEQATSTPGTLHPPKDWYKDNPPMGLG